MDKNIVESVSKQMRAIRNKDLEIEKVKTPTPAPEEVLVKIIAAGVNRADVMQKNGHYPPPPGITDIIGMEISGIIVQLGNKDTVWKIGDEVCAIISGGGYAEYATVPVGQLMPIPKGISLIDAVALPETSTTVWSNLVVAGKLQPGQTVLIHGGSSGIGSHAIQIAKNIGAKVITTVGSEVKAKYVKKLGADVVINYHKQDFEQELINSIDLVLDIVGAKYLQKNLKVLNINGRLVIIGMMGGVQGNLDLGMLIYKRAQVIGTNVRNRPLKGPGSKAEIVSEVIKNVWPLVETGMVKPVISGKFPLAEAAEAHKLLDSAESVGKIILLP